MAPNLSIEQEYERHVIDGVEIEDGMYRFENRFYKVQHAVHGSGNQYAKEAIIESVPSHLGAAHDTWTVRFEYAKGIVAKVFEALGKDAVAGTVKLA